MQFKHFFQNISVPLPSVPMVLMLVIMMKCLGFSWAQTTMSADIPDEEDSKDAELKIAIIITSMSMLLLSSLPFVVSYKRQQKLHRKLLANFDTSISDSSFIINLVKELKLIDSLSIEQFKVMVRQIFFELAERGGYGEEDTKILAKQIATNMQRNCSIYGLKRNFFGFMSFSGQHAMGSNWLKKLLVNFPRQQSSHLSLVDSQSLSVGSFPKSVVPAAIFASQESYENNLIIGSLLELFNTGGMVIITTEQDRNGYNRRAIYQIFIKKLLDMGVDAENIVELEAFSEAKLRQELADLGERSFSRQGSASSGSISNHQKVIEGSRMLSEKLVIIFHKIPGLDVLKKYRLTPLKKDDNRLLICPVTAASNWPISQFPLQILCRSFCLHTRIMYLRNQLPDQFTTSDIQQLALRTQGVPLSLMVTAFILKNTLIKVDCFLENVKDNHKLALKLNVPSPHLAAFVFDIFDYWKQHYRHVYHFILFLGAMNNATIPYMWIKYSIDDLAKITLANEEGHAKMPQHFTQKEIEDILIRSGLMRRKSNGYLVVRKTVLSYAYAYMYRAKRPQNYIFSYVLILIRRFNEACESLFNQEHFENSVADKYIIYCSSISELINGCKQDFSQHTFDLVQFYVYSGRLYSNRSGPMIAYSYFFKAVDSAKNIEVEKNYEIELAYRLALAEVNLTFLDKGAYQLRHVLELLEQAKSHLESAVFNGWLRKINGALSEVSIYQNKKELAVAYDAKIILPNDSQVTPMHTRKALLAMLNGDTESVRRISHQCSQYPPQTYTTVARIKHLEAGCEWIEGRHERALAIFREIISNHFDLKTMSVLVILLQKRGRQSEHHEAMHYCKKISAFPTAISPLYFVKETEDLGNEAIKDLIQCYGYALVDPWLIVIWYSNDCGDKSLYKEWLSRFRQFVYLEGDAVLVQMAYVLMVMHICKMGSQLLLEGEERQQVMNDYGELAILAYHCIKSEKAQLMLSGEILRIFKMEIEQRWQIDGMEVRLQALYRKVNLRLQAPYEKVDKRLPRSTIQRTDYEANVTQRSIIEDGDEGAQEGNLAWSDAPESDGDILGINQQQTRRSSAASRNRVHHLQSLEGQSIAEDAFANDDGLEMTERGGGASKPW
jgi:hypothetical protein